MSIEEIKKAVMLIVGNYPISRVVLFGPRANGTAKEDSDVDVCVEMKPNLFNRAGVKVYLEEILGCAVDVVRMRDNMNQLFKQQILKYGIRVY